MRAPLEERFWKNVAEPNENGCREWTASRTECGYGRLFVGGQLGFKTRVDKAHRIGWALENGPIPEGMWVLHKCDNPPCVWHEHLFLGDAKVNTTDCRAKGRMHFGEANGMSRLTEDDIRTIRRRYSEGETQERIAQDFAMHQGGVSRIVLRKRWPLVD